jgi:hypothetical protein
LNGEGQAAYTRDLKQSSELMLSEALVNPQHLLADSALFHGRLGERVENLRGGILYAAGNKYQQEEITKPITNPQLVEEFRKMGSFRLAPESRTVRTLDVGIMNLFVGALAAYEAHTGWIWNRYATTLWFGDVSIVEGAQFQLNAGFASMEQGLAQQLGALVTSDPEGNASKLFIEGDEGEIQDLFGSRRQRVNPFVVVADERVPDNYSQRVPVHGRFWGGKLDPAFLNLVGMIENRIHAEYKKRNGILDLISRYAGLQLDRLVLVILIAATQPKENLFSSLTVFVESAMRKMYRDGIPTHRIAKLTRFLERLHHIALAYQQGKRILTREERHDLRKRQPDFRETMVAGHPPISRIDVMMLPASQAVISRDAPDYGIGRVLDDRGLSMATGARLAARSYSSVLVGIPVRETSDLKLGRAGFKKIARRFRRTRFFGRPLRLRVLFVDDLNDNPIEVVRQTTKDSNEFGLVLDADGQGAVERAEQAIVAANRARFRAVLAAEPQPEARVDLILENLPAMTAFDLKRMAALKPFFEDETFRADDIVLPVSVSQTVSDVRTSQNIVVTERLIREEVVPLSLQIKILKAQSSHRVRVFVAGTDKKTLESLVQEGLIEAGDMDAFVPVVFSSNGKIAASAVINGLKRILGEGMLKEEVSIAGHEEFFFDAGVHADDKPFTGVVSFRGASHLAWVFFKIQRAARKGMHVHIDLRPIDWRAIRDAINASRSATISA